MLYGLSILAVQGDDSGARLVVYLVAAAVVVIGTIVRKIKEASQEPPRRQVPPSERSEDDEEESAARLPRPMPPRSQGLPSRPMPRVPRPATRGGDRPIGIPKSTGPVPLPDRTRPIPPAAPAPRRPAERPAARVPEPRPARPPQPAVSVVTSQVDRLKSAIAGTTIRQDAVVAAPQRKPGDAGKFRLTPARLREAIVLREVLGPPVSMREGEHFF